MVARTRGANSSMDPAKWRTSHPFGRWNPGGVDQTQRNKVKMGAVGNKRKTHNVTKDAVNQGVPMDSPTYDACKRDAQRMRG